MDFLLSLIDFLFRLLDFLFLSIILILLFIKIEFIKLIVFSFILIEFLIFLIKVNLDFLNLGILGNTEGSIENSKEVSGVISWVVKSITRVQQSGFVEKYRHLSGIFIIWVVFDSLKEFLDDWMMWVDLKGLLLSVLRSVLLLSVSLGSSDFLHLSGVTTGSGENHNWVGDKLLTDDNRLTLFFELILEVVSQGLVHLSELLEFSLLNIVLWELEVSFSYIN